MARRSPLLARVTADAANLRAMFGSASMLATLARVVLGIAAVQHTGRAALGPVLTSTVAITVLDAAAGLAAVMMFTSGVLLRGGSAPSRTFA